VSDYRTVADPETAIRPYTGHVSPGIPNPLTDEGALYEAVLALKQSVEILLREAGTTEEAVGASAVRVDDLRELVQYLDNRYATTFQLTSFAQLVVTAPGTSLSDITASWTKLNVLTLEPVLPNRVVTDSANSAFAITRPGTYLLHVWLSLEHNSSASLRNFALQLYNETAASVVPYGITVRTPANDAATNMAGSIIFTATDAEVGDTFSLRVGNASATYSSVDVYAAGFALTSIGDWVGGEYTARS